MRKGNWLTAGFLLLSLVAHVHVALAADNCHGEDSLFDCSSASSDWSLQGDWSLTDGSGDNADTGSIGDEGDDQDGADGNPSDDEHGAGEEQGETGNADQGDDAGDDGGQGDGDAGEDDGNGKGGGNGRGNTVVVSVNGLQNGAWSLALAPVEDGDLYTYSTVSLSEPSITVAAANKDVWVTFSDGALYPIGQQSPDPALCPLYFWSAPASNPGSQPAYYYTSEPGSGGCENRAASTGQILLPSSGLDPLTRLYSGDAVRIPKWQTETFQLTRLAIQVANLTDLPANQAFDGTLVVTVSG